MSALFEFVAMTAALGAMLAWATGSALASLYFIATGRWSRED